ncbi:MAG: rod-binding protein [Deltaproteobacteria bacterium]|nr:rod-binding protein [Deltaproteobacteria bacterium]
MSGINGIQGSLALPSAGAGKGKETPAEMKKALQDFEAIFINQMLKVMRESVGKGDLFHGGSGEEVYSSLFDMELSKVISGSGGIGLGEMLMKQLGGGYAAAEEKNAAAGAQSLPAVAQLLKKEVME